jgi:hypothetical protein
MREKGKAVGDSLIERTNVATNLDSVGRQLSKPGPMLSGPGSPPPLARTGATNTAVAGCAFARLGAAAPGSRCIAGLGFFSRARRARRGRRGCGQGPCFPLFFVITA